MVFGNIFKKKSQSAPKESKVDLKLVQVQNTPLFVKSPPQKLDRNFVMATGKAIEAIQSTPVGREFFNELRSRVTKQVTIVYMQSGHSCRCGSKGQIWLRRLYSKVRSSNLGSSAGIVFAAELRNTMQRAQLTPKTLGKKLASTRLPTWTGELEDPKWWRASRPDVRGSEAEEMIQGWLNNRSRPDDEQMDGLLAILRPFLTPGEGAPAIIRFNPFKQQTKKLEVSLFHELVHAYYTATGGQLGTEDSGCPHNGGRFFEIQSVGLPPFDTAPYSENSFGRSFNAPQRTCYVAGCTCTAPRKTRS